MGATYQVYAIRYGTRAVQGEPLFLHSDLTFPRMDYFTWVAINERTGEAIAIDTGYSRQSGETRGRTYLAPPAALMQEALGVDPRSIETLIMTHLHYDHTGHFDDFPNATLFVQGEEVRFVTGPCAHRKLIKSALEPADLTRLVELNLEGRVEMLEGSSTIAEGIEVHKVGGHTPGLQIVTIETGQGTVVLANDAVHYLIELEQDLIFNLVVDVSEAYRALSVIRTMAAKPELIIPGHDPVVTEMFEPVAGHENVLRIA